MYIIHQGPAHRTMNTLNVGLFYPFLLVNYFNIIDIKVILTRYKQYGKSMYHVPNWSFSGESHDHTTITTLKNAIFHLCLPLNF